MKRIRLTTAQAIIRFLLAQKTVVDGREVPLFPAAFTIFGHGNALGIGQALHSAGSSLPTFRWQNEQGMGHAAAAFAKAARRRQIVVVTTSIGPGALNVVTAAGVAHANRLPMLILCGDTFASRIPDPVLQQIEDFGVPSTTANDAFRPVSRFWDRVTRPEQIVQALPVAVQTMLDPADCGPVFLGLPQDVQAECWEYPAQFFEPRIHRSHRLRADRRLLGEAATMLGGAQRPLVIAGGGVHYSGAESELSMFAAAHGLPVVETVAGKASLRHDDRNYIGPIGVTGCEAANRLAADADVVVAIGTRLQDFTTGSWTVFKNEAMRLIGINAARFDASKHRALAIVADARETLLDLDKALQGYVTEPAWKKHASEQAADYRCVVNRATKMNSRSSLSYAQVVGLLNQVATPDDYIVTAAGGLPGELNVNWRSLGIGTVDSEYGFSCMGYEIAGSIGARMQRKKGEVFCLVGDGSYLMLNSELYSSITNDQKVIVILCDNSGHAVIERLQQANGGESFMTMLSKRNPVDWIAHARAMGCASQTARDAGELRAALEEARSITRTSVIAVPTDPHIWTDGGAFWEVGIPQMSSIPEVCQARAALEREKLQQRVGW